MRKPPESHAKSKVAKRMHEERIHALDAGSHHGQWRRAPERKGEAGPLAEHSKKIDKALGGKRKPAKGKKGWSDKAREAAKKARGKRGRRGLDVRPEMISVVSGRKAYK